MLPPSLDRRRNERGTLKRVPSIAISRKVRRVDPRGYCAMSSPDSLESSGTLWVRTLAPEMLRQFESPLLESGVDGRRISARSRRASPSASHQLRPKTSPKTRLSLKSGDGTPRKRKAARRRPDISRATANSRERFRQRGRGPRHRLEGAASPLRALSPNARAAETRGGKKRRS
jgi:hypothetical protein